MAMSERGGAARLLERVGRATVSGVIEVGQAAALFFEGLMWVFVGPFRRQPVRVSHVFRQAMEVGVQALPIVTLLSLTIGAMLAIQGIYTLRTFGAEHEVTTGIALSVTREFAPLITAILVAGRSGSALTARIGTMRINQEIDALRVIGIAPVRYLVSPALLAMLIMVPMLTFWSDVLALLGAGIYVTLELNMSMGTYASDVIAAISLGDMLHGLGKSVIFAVLITLIGVVNGATVSGGAEGVGRATTRSVVQAISAIIVTDMIFAFVLTR